MALIGTLTEFDGEKTSWSSWAERLEQYFSANTIPPERQVAVFLTAVGANTYDTLRDLLFPEKPASKALQELLKLLEDHFQPKPLEIAERFRFYQRQQQPGEDIKTYVVALRKLASTCSFGEYLPTALRDKFVLGLNSETIQRKLLTEKGLTLTSAVEIASVMEMAEVQQFRKAASDRQSVNSRPQVTDRVRSGGMLQARCTRCNRAHGMKMLCPAKRQEVQKV
uniref:Uncharacterized protein n=1 Tax=Leptobrachium leishanense TaxID=445787 RepID=A0A8C5PNH2_9ANUR